MVSDADQGEDMAGGGGAHHAPTRPGIPMARGEGIHTAIFRGPMSLRHIQDSALHCWLELVSNFFFFCRSLSVARLSGAGKDESAAVSNFACAGSHCTDSGSHLSSAMPACSNGIHFNSWQTLQHMLTSDLLRSSDSRAAQKLPVITTLTQDFFGPT